MLPKIMCSFNLALAAVCALMALRLDGSETMVYWYWCGMFVFTAGLWFAICKK